MAPFAALARYTDVGLLIVRLGVGAMFLTHGVPKLLGGMQSWERTGRAMAHVGLDFAPAFWGLMAGLSETLGGLLLMLGLFARAACLPLAFTMLMASIHHIARGDGLGRASHAIEAFFLFVGLFFIGPGRYSLDKR